MCNYVLWFYKEVMQACWIIYSVCERNENPEAKLPEALVSSADAVSPHRCLRDFFQLQNSGFEQMLMVDPVQMISSCHTNALKINTTVLCLL